MLSLFHSMYTSSEGALLFLKDTLTFSYFAILLYSRSLLRRFLFLDDSPRLGNDMDFSWKVMVYVTLELEKRWPLSIQKFFWGGISDVFVLSFLLLLFVVSIISSKVPWFSCNIILSYLVIPIISLSLGIWFCYFYGKNLERFTDHLSINLQYVTNL